MNTAAEKEGGEGDKRKKNPDTRSILGFVLIAVSVFANSCKIF